MHRRFQGEAIPRASIYAYAESEHHPSLIVREGELQRTCELERIARRAIDANPNSRFGSVEEMYDEIVKAEWKWQRKFMHGMYRMFCKIGGFYLQMIAAKV